MGCTYSPSIAEYLLWISEANILAIQLIFGGARLSSAYHGFSAAQLPTRDESHRAAARTRHDGDKGVLSVTQFGLVFENENRSRVHSFGDPFFQKL
jgi:hypothetical protein